MLHLACAAEGAYVPRSAAMLHSVLAQRGELDVRVHYLHSPRLTARAHRRLTALVEGGGGSLDLLEIADRAVTDFPSEHRFTPAMWYRLFLPELLPDVERVIYLDADTLAMDALAPLWNTDLGDHWVGAVTNVFEPWSAGRPVELGLGGPRDYFNSGVLLLNLEQMRHDGRGEALRACVRERGHDLLWPDQDALNLVLGERRLPLHPRWNCMNSLFLLPWSRDAFDAETIEEARARPGIRHFEGPGRNKPWHPLSRAPGRWRWRAHRLRA